MAARRALSTAAATAAAAVPRSSASSASSSSASIFNTALRCTGCNATVDSATSLVFACPNKQSHPAIDHVLAPIASEDFSPSSSCPPCGTVAAPAAAAALDRMTSPFVRYRKMLHAYRVARTRGMSDDEYVALVEDLESALERVDGTGFIETPLAWNAELRCFVKNETGNVGQSHKARHLAGVMLYLLVMRRTAAGPTTAGEAAAGGLDSRRLAVASCGNAGLAAAVIAAAANWPIDVCIPDNANPSVVARLKELGADVHICRRDGAPIMTPLGEVPTTGEGDPTYAAFKNLVKTYGSIPFSVQGPECGLAQEGGQTLAWEILESLSRDYGDIVDPARGIGNLYIQVGGGALGAAMVHGLRRAVSGELAALVGPEETAAFQLPRMPTIHTVQPVGNGPLSRAFEAMHALASSDNEATAAANAAAGRGQRGQQGQQRLGKADRGRLLSSAASAKDQFMYPWQDPHSIASGILDDETYDWLALCDGMLETAGTSLTVQDDIICEAKEIASQMKIPVCHTGSAGLAGLLQERRAAAEEAAVGADGPAAPPDLIVCSGLDRT
eukprot:g5422.t1